MKNLRIKSAKTSKQIHLLLITKTSSETRTAPHQKSNQSDDLLCELYNCYASSLRAVIFNLVPSAETTEDLLHDSFVKINNALHTYQPQRSQLFTWMKTIARNTTVDYLRMKSTRNSTLNKPIDFCKEELNVQYFSSVNTDLIGIKQLAERLSPENFSIINLVYFQHFTHEEAAKKLGMPLGTLKTRLRKSITQLKQLFN
ncbi:RNA polymerase sigma factor [Pedobacter endophyticus]|uniref:Sigma-70 family RNA polymerase sigma factor n=1 Tax=Pedobacter endophyticus TaxID=2789740 RepID=A0A7S9L2J4_9SPHI|nr:sigma-70 family RNA polymerase sigma factor [Pedobacter endophyticus]QPH41297.1 sigma-70 family RNA polymerase sigma factor [Pedobacter endophyticus]